MYEHDSMCNCVCDLRMRQNGTLHVEIGPNWTFSDWSKLEVLIQNVTNQPSDSSVQAGFPEENRSEGERGVRNTWILQCRIPV